MQFNSEAGTLDLVSDINFLCGSDTTSYPLADKARNANFALDRITALILKADGRWQHDDTNNSSTELLDVTTNLVSGTAKYATTVTWLKITRVRVKDSAGNWITLTPRDRRQQSDTDLVASGTPSTYDVTGNWIYPRPVPNYASTGGLEVQYQRGASYFTAADTTKTPGFATPFHRLVSLYAALNYCEVNDMDKRVQKLMGMIQRMEADLIDFYSQRDADTRIGLRPAYEDYGQAALGSSASPNHGF